MKGVRVLLLLLLAWARAEHRGKDYVRDKVCQEYRTMGKEDFRALTIIMNSKKFSNATFEEISHLVHEIVSLAETCCSESADPSCYDDGSELCADFAKDPKGFADRFLYEFASDYSQAPLPVLLGSARSFLSMVSTCCMSPAPTTCFLKEKLQRKTLSLLTLLSNRACSRFTAYGKDKMKFSYLTTLAQKTPSASFEEIFPLAEDAAEMFAQCCDSVAEDCMQKKVGSAGAATHRALWPQPAPYRAPALEVPEDTQPRDPHPLLCPRYMFETARRHPSVPDVFLSKLYDTCKEAREQGCSTKDSSACLDSKKQQVRGELLAFVAKADELCSLYHRLDFLDFKKRVKEALVQSAGPGTAPEHLAELAERRADFATHCCSANAPPRHCAQQKNPPRSGSCPAARSPLRDPLPLLQVGTEMGQA
ncbi:PREDICTED: vitamin D-binding protein [Tinamus guttatus]|uniref:vitamin D-binding protein n=1 Tax=Tinamus guttatus TaxID=94827 RepID=UPI00052ED468|nr:PREDICTED: vitamin D-binding protein [Tinamus guttatus]